MKNLLSLFILLLFSIIKLTAQQYGEPYPIITKWGSLDLDSLNFNISKIIDQRNDKTKFASIKGGLLDLRYDYRIKKGIPKAFDRFFYKGLRYTEKGDLDILISFKNFYVYEGDEQREKFAERNRKYKIEVDYYLQNGKDLNYLYTDKRELDSTAKTTKYFIEDFLEDYFEGSLLELHNHLEKNTSKLGIQENSESINDSIESNEAKSQEKPEISTKSLAEDSRLENLDSIPKTSQILDEHCIGFERFNGTTASGLRFRYLYFQREWDNLNWKPAFSFDIEAIALNESFDDNTDIFTVDYSYFAIGVGAIKPFNNFLFLELGLKFAFGSERIVYDPFYNRDNTNFLFGVQLSQRIHLMLGKGFGFFLSCGTYENFYPTTEYLKTDFGFSFGGGLKF
jgi:hypothetical protein